MCIINGGVKVTMKGKGRMQKLVWYECKNSKCGKLWSLSPDGCFHVGQRIFCGYDRRGFKKYRKEGHCNCGTMFEIKHTYLNRT